MPSVWPWRHHLTWYRPINGGGIVRRIKRHTSTSEHWIIIYSTVMTDCTVAPALCLRRLASSMGDSNFRPLHRHRPTGWNWFGGGAQACFPDKTGSGAAAAEPVARERRRPYPRNLKKMIAGNAFSKHFRRFVVTLKEWVIPRKRQGELDSDPKMNQTERWLPVYEQW